MAVGEEEQVLIFSIHGELRIVFHGMKEKCGKIVRTPERAARMTTLYCMYHTNDIPSYLGRYVLKFLYACHNDGYVRAKIRSGREFEGCRCYFLGTGRIICRTGLFSYISNLTGSAVCLLV